MKLPFELNIHLRLELATCTYPDIKLFFKQIKIFNNKYNKIFSNNQTHKILYNNKKVKNIRQGWVKTKKLEKVVSYIYCNSSDPNPLIEFKMFTN